MFSDYYAIAHDKIKHETFINSVLKTFSVAQIELRRNGVFVYWDYKNTRTYKRWQCRGQDFYPVWSRKYPGGGTSCIALSQLIRWLQRKPILPLSTWEMWSKPNYGLIEPRVVEALRIAGYPESVRCVLCKNTIVGGLDWWSLDNVKGPCCSSYSGCRQSKITFAPCGEPNAKIR